MIPTIENQPSQIRYSIFRYSNVQILPCSWFFFCCINHHNRPSPILSPSRFYSFIQTIIILFCTAYQMPTGSYFCPSPDRRAIQSWRPIKIITIIQVMYTKDERTGKWYNKAGQAIAGLIWLQTARRVAVSLCSSPHRYFLPDWSCQLPSAGVGRKWWKPLLRLWVVKREGGSATTILNSVQVCNCMINRPYTIMMYM